MSPEQIADAVKTAVAPLAERIEDLTRQIATLQASRGDVLVSQQQAADMRGVKTRTLRQWEAEGRLQRVNTEGHPRYRTADVLAA